MSAHVCLFPGAAPSAVEQGPECGLDAHETFVAAARNLYAPNVVWTAPNRSIECQGREALICHLLREGSGMREPDFTLLRRNVSEHQIIDEYAVRFVYTGEGIENAPIARGDFVELKRVRVLTMNNGRCTHETCVESFTTLLPADRAK